MSNDKKAFHQEFAERIISMLEAGTAPWQKPWNPVRDMAPRNPLSGTVYRGSNRVWLSMMGHEDPRWMTLKQANDAGFKIRKGSRSTPVVYYQFTREQDKLDDAGNPVLDENGKPQRETVELERPILRMARVFNAEQVENFPPIPERERKLAWDPQAKAENILSRSGAVIKHDQNDRNFYRPYTDEIHLTPKESFDAADKYYATALHELGHWTGHSSRMNREFGPFGSEKYAQEELRAEISSWMVGQDIGVGHDPGQHAAYVQSWIKALREDPLEIMRACRDAEHIRDYVLGLEMDKEQLLEQEAISFIQDALPYLEKSRGLEMVAQDAAAVLQGEWPYNERINDCFSVVVQAVQSGHFEGPKALYDRSVRLLESFDAHSREQELNESKSKGHDSRQDRAQPSAEPAPEKTYLAVPFKDKEKAKAHGARWDREQKQWYAPEGTDLAPLRKYLTPEPQQKTASTLSPQEEFARKLDELGLDLKGKLPEMDGKLHRVPLKGRSEVDGAYCLYGDGVPAGWAQNFSSGEKIKLVASGVVLSAAERQKQKKEHAARLEAAKAERVQQHEAAAVRCRELWNGFEPDPQGELSPYLSAKGVQDIAAKDSLRVDPAYGNLIVPLHSVDGEMRGFQAIAPDGQKSFARGIEKKGNFHLLNSEAKDFSQGEILLCEGYATGASLHLATGQPVAVAFDSGNLTPVAEALRKKYPNAVITVCADNDHALQKNVGVEKAKEAAQKVNGKVRIPVFSDREKKQGLKDFNDLHQSQGLAAVQKQLAGKSRERGME